MVVIGPTLFNSIQFTEVDRLFIRYLVDKYFVRVSVI